MTPERVHVALPDTPYDVVIGRSCLARIAELVPLPEHARQAVIVTDEHVGPLYAPIVEGSLRDAGLGVTTVAVAAGERAKTLASVSDLYTAFAGVPLGRDDLVVALGGGVVGDMTGFAAASWHRGVAVLQVPTTVLAQVDAAIGGKTGVNLPEGKNLVGAFHQPVGVLADVDTLVTLPERDRRAGLGEVAKYGFIADPEILTLLENRPDAAVQGEPDLALDLVRRSAQVKAAVVAADEKESGLRALLNYGHTFGHAFEALTGYERYRHGEAVALGMVAAARLAERLGVAEVPLSERTEAVLSQLGLPTGGLVLDPGEVWASLARDKKARRGVRFVLCTRPGNALLVDEPDRTVVNEVLWSLA